LLVFGEFQNRENARALRSTACNWLSSYGWAHLGNTKIERTTTWFPISFYYLAMQIQYQHSN